MTVICLICIIIIFVGDTFLKNKVEENILTNTTKSICHGKILLRNYHNEGAVFNFGEKQRKLVVILSVFLTIIAFFFFLFSLGKHGNSFLRLGLSLLLGGAFSNTYDRLKRKYVVDYISFRVKNKKIRNLVFNFSDFCIMLGAVFFLLGIFLMESE